MAVRITIGIPTHNRRETVLLAVASALGQSRPPSQVTVLCDACTDGTAEAVRALGDARVSVLELPKGLHYAYEHRNLPLHDPEADVVLWLADDDLLLPDHLERIGALWDADDGLAMVTTPAVIVHEDDRLEWLGRDWRIPSVRRALHERENHCPMTAVSVRAAAARAAGGWIGSTEREGDRRLWMRMLEGDARVERTDVPSVLHFRATTREQAWPDRVAQNTRWLARVQDPAQLAALRVEMDTAHRLREARDYEQLLALEAALDARVRQLLEEGDERGRLMHRLQVTSDELDRVRREAGEQAWRAEVAEADRDAARATLEAIYAGGWWRLRDRLRAPLRRR